MVGVSKWRRRIGTRDAFVLVGFVLLVNAIGAAPGVLFTPDTEWFRSLEKPWFYPPEIAFPVVWTLLFTLLALALFLIWRRGIDRGPVRVALAAFVLQFAVNVAWTPVFFGLERPLAALGVIALLWVLVLATVAAFARVDRRAAALLVPYLLWVSFATVLNYSLWALNA